MAELHCTPSTLEVDYGKNLTALYKSITDQDWSRAITFCKKYPKQAATWVVRHYEEEDDDDTEAESKDIMWRFLPLHSACARQPPTAVIAALLAAYPDAAKCVDDQGMYALHYACGNQATRDVIRQLLVGFPEAAMIADPRGMLPIHYVACWGPSSVAVVNMLMVTNSQVASALDADNNTPLDLALEGDYPEKDTVVEALQKWIKSEKDKSTADAAKSTDKTTIGGKIPTFNTQNRSLFDATTDSSMSSMGSSLKPRSVYSRVNRVFNVVNTVPEEEKKEDDYDNATTGDSTLSHVQEELGKIRGDMNIKERGWKEFNKELEATWSEKFSRLETKSNRQQDELTASKKELKMVKEELEGKASKLTELTKELEETKNNLKFSASERTGLQVTLGDLMEQHESFKKRSGNMNDRLGSLSASLESMMEQQIMLTATMKQRNTTVKESFTERQQRLTELMELEKSMEVDESKLENALKKQTKEMEAIAAVIAAARD